MIFNYIKVIYLKVICIKVIYINYLVVIFFRVFCLKQTSERRSLEIFYWNRCLLSLMGSEKKCWWFFKRRLLKSMAFSVGDILKGWSFSLIFSKEYALFLASEMSKSETKQFSWNQINSPARTTPSRTKSLELEVF